MPKILRPQKVVDPLVEQLNAFAMQRLALGFLVARECGIDAPFDPLVGQHDLFARWRNGTRLPKGLADLRPSAKLLYRFRILALSLNSHPNAAICGGPEMWWQRVLDEQLLSATVQRLLPTLMPELATVKPPQRATTSWWMRRGINPISSISAPATWALIEAAQSRSFYSRPECQRPEDDVPLPVAALNGDMSLHERKRLIRKLTGSANGYSPRVKPEHSADWGALLTAWQETAKPAHKKVERLRARDASQYDAVAILVGDAVLPPIWESITEIRASLNSKRTEKLSCSNCSGYAKEIGRRHAA